MRKTHKLAALLAGAAAAGVYAAVRGKGVFNGPRFAKQHDAVQRYIDAKHKNAEYSPIEQVSNGWCTIVTETDGRKLMLYVTCDENGVFVFHEKRL